MGLLAENLIEHDFTTVSSFYQIHLPLPPTSYENDVLDMGYWGTQCIDDIGALPTIIDSKDRIRIDEQALLDLILYKFVRKHHRRNILAHHPYINISSSREKVYYVIALKEPYIPARTQGSIDMLWAPPITHMAAINLISKSH